MSDLFESLIQHSSVRAFEKQPLMPAIKQKLILAAQSASSSNFMQAYSIIEVQNTAKRAQIEDLANCPGYIKDTGVFYIFVADLHKHAEILAAAGQAIEPIKTLEPFLVAVVDTAIAAQNMAVYAESVDLGICYIGGIRNDLFQMKQLLKLPAYTFPLFGLTIGQPTQRNEVKKRLPVENISSIDHYQSLSVTDLKAYDAVMTQYYGTRSSNQQNSSWSEKVRHYFKEPKRPATSAFLKEQGFVF